MKRTSVASGGNFSEDSSRTVGMQEDSGSHQTLSYAENRLNEYIHIGSSTLDSLRSQKNMLKGAQRRVLDAGMQLGIGQQLMRVISRKTAQDRWIFYAGLLVIILTIYLVWKYL